VSFNRRNIPCANPEDEDIEDAQRDGERLLCAVVVGVDLVPDRSRKNNGNAR
jgi:hypothetical protein